MSPRSNARSAARSKAGSNPEPTSVAAGASRVRPVVLGIKGSPRRRGNTDRLLDAALEAAEAAGAETRVLVASTAGVLPCFGCNACARTGECAQRDEGTALYAALDSADVIIVASPVYFAGVPSVLKTVIDRLQPYWARRFVLGAPRPPRRVGGILMARAGGDPYGFAPAEASIRSGLAILGVDVSAVLRAEGIDGRDDLDDNPEPLRRAAELGTAVAEEAFRRLVARQ